VSRVLSWARAKFGREEIELKKVFCSWKPGKAKVELLA
jgi:hypothetical protein